MPEATKRPLRHQTLAAMKRARLTTKHCPKCKIWKSRSLFFKNKREFDALESYCKSCRAQSARAYRKTETGGQKIRESQNKWRSKNPEKTRKYERDHRNKYPEKHRARIRAKGFIRRGKIIRGDCEVCGKLKAEAHHSDYTKPLEITWLCKKHHVEHHNKLNNHMRET